MRCALIALLPLVAVSCATGDRSRTEPRRVAPHLARRWDRALERAVENALQEPAPTRRTPSSDFVELWQPGASADRAAQPGASLVDTDDRYPPTRRGQFLIAPVPFRSPTVGWGLNVAIGYIFPIDKNDEISPPSFVGGAFFGTENESFGGGLGARLYLAEDTYRVTLAGGAARVNWDFYVNEVDITVPLQQQAGFVYLEALRSLGKGWFLGPEVVAFDLQTKVRSDLGDLLPEGALDTRNLILGLHLQADSRDDTFYPRDGWLFDLKAQFNDEAWGSAFSYQVYPFALNRYVSLSRVGVLALRFQGRLSFGDVPFWARSMLGDRDGLRGFEAGAINDRHLLTVQAEYRHEICRWFGAVVFGGLGVVAPEVEDLFSADVHDSIGFGLRFKLSQEYHTNYRIDFAWGDGDFVVYLALGEAF
jgi:outer membrane protein assembly factor BamA